MKLVRADEIVEKMKKFEFNSKIISVEVFVRDELSAVNTDKHVTSVTVRRKDGEQDTFRDINGIEFTSKNPGIMVIVKENDGFIYVNMNEVMYVEEETE